MTSNKSVIFRIGWKRKKERNREIALQAWINACSLFLSALIFSEDVSYSCEHPRCRWEEYFPCKFSLHPGQAVRKWSCPSKKRFAMNPSSSPQRTRVCSWNGAHEKFTFTICETAAILSEQLLPPRHCRADTSRGTRVYAFSSVVPRKKLRIERAREKEEEKKWKGEHRGGTRLSSPEFDRFSSRSQDVFRSPTGFLCPLKWGISFPLKKKGNVFSSLISRTSDSLYKMWTAAVYGFSRSSSKPREKIENLFTIVEKFAYTELRHITNYNSIFQRKDVYTPSAISTESKFDCNIEIHTYMYIDYIHNVVVIKFNTDYSHPMCCFWLKCAINGSRCN